MALAELVAPVIREVPEVLEEKHKQPTMYAMIQEARVAMEVMAVPGVPVVAVQEAMEVLRLVLPW